MFYITLLILSVLFLVRDHVPKHINNAIPIILIISIISVKFGIGADYFSYQVLYENLIASDFGSIFDGNSGIDIGFKLIMYVAKNMHLSFAVFFSIINSLIVFLFFYSIIKYSSNSSLSILLFYSMFFLVWSLSGIRQGLAMAICIIPLLKSFESKLDIFDFVVLAIAYSIHSSSLIALLLILIGKIQWNKKIHLVVFISALVFSYFNVILLLVSKIPFMKDHRVISAYLTADYSLFDFPGVIRLLIFFVIWLFYNRITEKKINKRLVDVFLFGMTMYFLLKFSEITASRLSVYAYILIIFIAPLLFSEMQKLISFRKLPNIILSLAVVLVASLYFEKEILTMNSQSGMNQTGYLIKVPTEKSYDILDFDNYSTVQLYINENLRDLKAEYNEAKTVQNVPYDVEHHYFVRRDYSIQKNVIINQDGNYLSNYGFDYDVEIRDGVLRYYSYTENSLDKVAVYSDVSNRNRSNSKLIEDWLSDLNREELFQPVEVNQNIELSQLPDFIKNIIRDESNVDLLVVNRVDAPFTYHVGLIKYYGLNIYFYLDENLNMLTEVLSYSPNRLSLIHI